MIFIHHYHEKPTPFVKICPSFVTGSTPYSSDRASSEDYQIPIIFSINGLYVETFQPLVISGKIEDLQ
jgi:hypothetical protein